MGFQIAIDGPSGAGKSTVAKRIAADYGFTYLDTGAMYRALGLFAAEQEKWPEDEAERTAVFDKACIRVGFSHGLQHLYLGNRDITGEIRTEEAGRLASDISKYADVRKKMVALQQKIASDMDVVMDGRDIGTVVLKNADLKIFLTASAQSRAQRRLLELKEKGEETDFEEVLQSINERDLQDTTRSASPLAQAEDAVYVDTSEMDFESVVARVKELIDERKA